MPAWPAIFGALRERGIEAGADPAPRAVAGGDISAAWRITSGGSPVFLKTGAACAFDMLDAEADGLRALRQAAAVRVPRVLCCGRAGPDSFLALEWLAFERPGPDAARELGLRLAAQHRNCSARFGWHRDNTLGRTPQINTPDEDWVRFFAEHRLRFQLELAAERGYTGELQEQGRRLQKRLPALFDGYEPEASLLHGDLWGGNWASVGGEPVIFDPAVHYGDRESDLAMTRLFGGFSQAFYDASEEVWPLDRGHDRRLPLYQLYHVLNHLNLFGGAYLGRAVALLSELNRACRQSASYSPDSSTM
jgi:protein-ribulosamine 3-kinase